MTVRHRNWFWRWRREGPPVIAEQADDGFWHLTIGTRKVGVVVSREAAEALIDKIEERRR